MIWITIKLSLAFSIFKPVYDQALIVFLYTALE